MSTAKREAFIWSNIGWEQSRGSFRIDGAGVTIHIGDAYAEPVEGDQPHPSITLSHGEMSWLAQRWQEFMWMSHVSAKRAAESDGG